MNNECLKKTIKICYIAPKAYPVFNPSVGEYFGGANVDLYYLATEMAKDGRFESSFIVADYGQPDGVIIEGVKLVKALDFSKGALSGMIRTWQALKRADADIYLMKCAGAGVPLTALFCRMHSKIFAYRTAHRFECDGTYLRNKFLLGLAFAWSLRRAGIVFTQNQSDTENLSATMGISSIVIPNGHRLPAIEQKPRDAILWVGRDADFKKPRRFLDLAKENPEDKFIMVCQTADNSPAYRDLVAEAGKIPNLQFIRHVPFNQIDEYFRRAKVFVNTSDAEGFPNTFIQACKCATPILSYNVNPDDFLGKYRCGLCAAGDRDSFIRMLKELLIPENGKNYGENSRRFVEQNNDIVKIAEQYKELFRKLLYR